MTEDAWQPDAGDLVWTEFNPENDWERAERRPALVVSSKAFTANTGLAVVCPIASRARPFPTSVVLPPGLPIEGEVLTSHIRCVDTLARRIIYAGASIGAALADEVRAKLGAVIVI
jgi:mRNA interferase MazF